MEISFFYFSDLITSLGGKWKYCVHWLGEDVLSNLEVQSANEIKLLGEISASGVAPMEKKVISTRLLSMGTLFSPQVGQKLMMMGIRKLSWQWCCW